MDIRLAPGDGRRAAAGAEVSIGIGDGALGEGCEQEGGKQQRGGGYAEASVSTTNRQSLFDNWF